MHSVVVFKTLLSSGLALALRRKRELQKPVCVLLCVQVHGILTGHYWHKKEFKCGGRKNVLSLGTMSPNLEKVYHILVDSLPQSQNQCLLKFLGVDQTLEL